MTKAQTTPSPPFTSRRHNHKIIIITKIKGSCQSQHTKGTRIDNDEMTTNFSTSDHDPRLVAEEFLNDRQTREQNGGTPTAFQQTELQDGSTRFWGTLSNRKRPFPSTQMMVASMDGSKKSPCPLIRDALKRAGKSHLLETQETSAEVNDGDICSTDEPKGESDLHIGAIEDSSFGTMTEGQHRRYLKLIELGKQSSRPVEKREFNKFRTMVDKEQALYWKALSVFWANQKDRLGLGFGKRDKVAIFRMLAIDMNLKLKDWHELKLPHTFGKCTQVVSLMHPPVDQKLHRMSPLESIRREKLHASEDLGSVRLQDFLKPGSDLSTFSKVEVSNGSVKLFQDERAVELARQHEADMILSESTLQLLLRVEDIGSWFLPAVRCNDERILVLGEPVITTFSCPRECLRVGLDEAVRNQIFASNQSPQEVVYDYILWTLPAKNQKTRKILIRRMCVPLDEESGMPLRIHLTPEYFPEKGREIVANSIMSLWMLDYILDPNSRVIHSRLEPKSATIMDYADVNLADALAATNSNVPPSIIYDTIPCIVRWHRLLRLLAVLPTIGSGKQLLRYPGDGRTPTSGPCISVHKLQDGSPNDVHDLFSSSGGVQLGAAGFQRCYRPWEWQDVRVPYTFPYRKLGSK